MAAFHGRVKQLILCAFCLNLSSRLAEVLPMDLPAMLVKLSLQSFQSHCRIPGQARSANRKVFVATRALAVQPRFVVLGDLKVWPFHASSMAQSALRFRTAKIQTAPYRVTGDVGDFAPAMFPHATSGKVRIAMAAPKRNPHVLSAGRQLGLGGNGGTGLRLLRGFGDARKYVDWHGENQGGVLFHSDFS